jgi:acetyl esterase
MDIPPWEKVLAQLGLENPFGPEKTAPHMRRALRLAAPHLDVKAPALKTVRDLIVPGADGDIAARFYIPKGLKYPAPCMMFIHGGGYIIGDLETHDVLCRRLAARSGVSVLAVDYRLAPEHPFPAATDDVLAAFDWLIKHGPAELKIDPDRLAVAGDSAGGGLAAVLGQKRREQIQFQLLIYPLMQLAEARKPHLKALEGHIFSVAALEQIIRAYVPEKAFTTDTRVSPMLENDLAGMPRTYIAAAELDPLLDEGLAYRDRLVAAGNTVEYVLGKALPHGYFNLTSILPGAKILVDKAGYALGDALPQPVLPRQITRS